MSILGGMFFAGTTFAAMISAQATKDTVASDGLIQVDVVMDSESENINTLKGVLVYDPNRLTIKQIITGDSVVNFWMDAPTNNSLGEVLFSGIIPGGILTKNGPVFSVIFSGKTEGIAEIGFKNFEVLLNDGEGTQTKTSFTKAIVSVTGKNVEKNETYDFSDVRAPEKFSIIRSRDTGIFDNKWFIVFSAQDKGSGIATYTVCESFFKKCAPQVSPFVLTRQSSWYTILVRAYDYDGNTRSVIKISANIYITAVTILFLVTFGILWRYVVRYKFSKKTL